MYYCCFFEKNIVLSQKYFNQRMTESKFVSQNKRLWEEYELMIDSPGMYSPSELGQAYLSLSSDLAFAQSHYPDAQVCGYLNALTLQYQHILYRRQPHRWRELLNFFIHDVPLSFYKSRKYILLSLALFILGQTIGVLSQMLDTDYFEQFFGLGYYQTTIKNIDKGNPMGIYASESELKMFFLIAFNNILVGLRYFISGLLTPFYVIYVTVMTGIMDGCFMTFFAQHGYLWDSVVAPNEHGALELPAAIICSAGGMQLGMGWFFPGRKSRMRALRDSAQLSVIMVMAMIPVFAVAAFIESFITRHQEWPLMLRLGIMFAGFAFIIYYCILLPKQIAGKEEMDR